MHKIELEIIALSHSITQSHSYAVVLGEIGGNRRLPIVIGAFEAQSIALALEKMTPKRPLTHDLAKNICDEFEVDVKEIIINNLIEGVFHARIVCEKDGKSVDIDSRTSDALALAVRFNCPVYTYESVLDKAGIILDVDDQVAGEEGESPRRSGRKVEIKSSGDYTTLSMEELKIKLDELLDKEEYEKAILIRDEIAKRGGEV